MEKVEEKLSGDLILCVLCTLYHEEVAYVHISDKHLNLICSGIQKKDSIYFGF